VTALYQLIRQPQPNVDRQFEIEFLDAGVETFAFTFGWEEDDMQDAINADRRRFLGAAAMTIAGAQFAAIEAGTVPSSQATASAPAPAAQAPSFGALQQIDAGVLNIGYAEAGPSGGPPVVLLHGWPYDIHSYVEVAPLAFR
jgi:hypothetical protein